MNKFILLFTIVIGILVFISNLYSIQAKPDLVVNRLEVTKDCKLRIRLKNIGSAGIPGRSYTNRHYKVGFQVKTNGKT